MKKILMLLALALTISAVCIPGAASAGSTSNAWRLNVLSTAATHTLNIALYYNTTLTGATCTVYTTANELATSGGYTQGGKTLSSVSASMSSNSAILSAASVSWASATFTTNAAMIYDASDSNRCIAVLKFPTMTKAAATFTLTIPSPLITLAFVPIKATQLAVCHRPGLDGRMVRWGEGADSKTEFVSQFYMIRKGA